VVVLLGTAALLHAVYTLAVHPIPYSWTLFAALTLFSGSFAIKLPSVPARISVSETFVFTAVLLYGGAPGTIIVALDGLIISLWRRDRKLHRVVFNATEPAVSIWVASSLFFAVAGVEPLARQTTQIGPLVVPLLVFTVTYFVLNSWLTAVAVSFETGISTFAIWRQHFLWISLNYFAGASVAILLARNTSEIDLSSLTVIVPLLVVSYLTFKTALQRIEDARAHVDKLNSLYLSTIETFALWIDAKDQVTHGHIRRVQRYALGLATELGVKDKLLLRAVEAAALLHDMGKLAVPEHILNKPGKLTTGEFEKMKLHASIGAQILSSIDFPYPVVPIVRHHHENWDGTGYPDHLAGTEIPIGARILAVVDCFDALTSDRPYRGKLTDEQALEILMDRRGTMYDPLVVDGFVKVHEALKGNVADTEGSTDGTPFAAASAHVLASRPAPLDPQRRGDGVVSLLQLARSLTAGAGVLETAEVVVRHLLELIPPALAVVFLYRPEADELEAVCAKGVGHAAIEGLKLRLGTGISGWVGANRQSLANCDPSLELSSLHCEVLSSLRNVYSIPLVAGADLVGVVTLYSVDSSGFSHSVVRTIDLLSPHISRALQEATRQELETCPRRDGATLNFDLKPALLQRPAILPDLPPRSPLVGRDVKPFAVVFLRVEPCNGNRLDLPSSDEMAARVARVTRENLRPLDLLLQYSDDSRDRGLILLLPDADAILAEGVAGRVTAALSSAKLISFRERPIRVIVSAGHAVAPTDGTSLDELVLAARGRAVRPNTADNCEAAL
jgi:putative nucleotidyltransferase with HDIG domain